MTAPPEARKRTTGAGATERWVVEGRHGISFLMRSSLTNECVEFVERAEFDAERAALEQAERDLEKAKQSITDLVMELENVEDDAEKREQQLAEAVRLLREQISTVNLVKERDVLPGQHRDESGILSEYQESRLDEAEEFLAKLDAGETP